jgi:hypothetical protein
MNEEAVKALGEWKRTHINRNSFLEAKRRYKERCERRRSRGGRGRRNEIRTEKKVWKYINRKRKKKESVREEITMQEWDSTGGREKGKAETEMKKKQTAPEETEITVELVER